MNQDKKIAILVFELGHLQVYHYQDMNSWMRKDPITEVYWLKKGENRQHGPFPNAYEAVNHYTTYIAEEVIPIPDNIIQVDFKNKKKIKQ